MNYFMGVDIGTTSVKAIAFDEKGAILCKQSGGYQMQHPQPGYSELNATDIFEAVTHSINNVIETLQPQKVMFISFSAMMHSLIAVDEKGAPLTNCILWADNRAAGIAEKLRQTEEGKRLYHATGVPIHAMSPFCKLLWLKEQEPKMFDAAYKFIGIKEYIFYQLFGTYIIDTAIASATGLLNMQSLQWEVGALDMLGISAEKLSAIVPVENLSYYHQRTDVTHSLHLPDETPFVTGSSDGALANLGAGSVANQSMSITIGTSAALRVLTDQPVTQPDMRTFCYHAIGKQYIVGGASNNGAIVLQWLKESILQTAESFPELFTAAESVGAGSNDLLFVPYILGERAPVWNADATGAFFGLTINHTKAHLIRAALEGVIFNLYSISKYILQTTPLNELYATGGFAQSTLWLQLVADIFNCKVLVSGTPESSALGAVMVGIKALQIPVEIHPEIVSVHEPDTRNHEIYEKGFVKFQRLYQVFTDEFATES